MNIFDSPTKVVVNLASFTVGAGLGLVFNRRRKQVEEAVVYEFDPQMEFPWDDTLVEEDSNDISGVVMDADVYEALSTPVIELPDPNVPEPEPEVDSDDGEVNEQDPEASEADAPVMKSVFSSADGNWDMEAELAARSNTAPYVIHEDEFLNDEMGYTQSTLTYYTVDNIMADEADVPIYPFDQVVGELKFGHGTNSAGSFYVRNDRLNAEYEILRIENSYEAEILGIRAEAEIANELRHSTYKFRSDE
jgi:hypothetical protein